MCVPRVLHHDLGHEQSGDGGQGQAHAGGPWQSRCSVTQVGVAAHFVHGVNTVIGIEGDFDGIVAVTNR